MRIRVLSYTSAFLLLNAALASAQDEAAATTEVQHGIMDIGINVMFYTLIIFLIMFWLVARYAYPRILEAVIAREKALEEAVEGAKRDREAAAALLAQHNAQLQAGRAEAQKFIADARQVADKMRSDLIEQTRKEQGEMLERAKRDIEGEREKAIAQLRREAVDLAIVGASKVIEENLDNSKNRQVVESYLASIGTNRMKS
jgi:F-type H+-transporting ATPase subunit b